jgi:RNA polymerase sigma factor (sigma-70 family)
VFILLSQELLSLPQPLPIMIVTEPIRQRIVSCALKSTNTLSYKDLTELESVADLAIAKSCQTWRADGAASFVTYATRCAANAIRDHLLKERRRPTETIEGMEFTTSSNEKAAELNEVLIKMNSLDKTSYHVVRLVAEGYTVREIQAALGMKSTSMVHRIHKAALTKLRG